MQVVLKFGNLNLLGTLGACTEIALPYISKTVSPIAGLRDYCGLRKGSSYSTSLETAAVDRNMNKGSGSHDFTVATLSLVEMLKDSWAEQP